MNVSLTPELEALVNQKVQSGLYSSASEVVREALRLMKERDDSRAVQLKQLKREISLGIRQLDRGQGVDADEVFEGLRQRHKKRVSKA